MIRETTPDDLPAVLDVHRRAFGGDDEALLVADLLEDPSAVPRLSLLALADDQPVGHVLFSAAQMEGATQAVRCSILAPLATVPEAQRQGHARALVEAGLRQLAAAGTDLVLVLGAPALYGRFGFEPATRRGIEAPYPLDQAYAEAWMVRGLRQDAVGTITGRTRCAAALQRPELWRE